MNSIDEITVDVKAQLSVSRSTAEACLKLVQEYVNTHSGEKVMATKQGDGSLRLYFEAANDQKKPEWIPTKQKLPEYNMPVLVSVLDDEAEPYTLVGMRVQQSSILREKGYDLGTMWMTSAEGGIWKQNAGDKVIGWMELPDPYEGE